MQKTLYVLFLFIILNSCSNNYKVCECNSENEQANIYSSILNELVEHHFYNRYLGDDQKQIFMLEASNIKDSAKVKRETIKLQNSIFQDTSKFCNIYLDTVYNPYFKPWTYYQNDTNRFAREIKDLITNFSNDGQSVIDSLNSMQTNLSPNEFQLCTSKILSVKELNNLDGNCAIGIVSFSKIFLDNAKTKGLIYYNFNCGVLCGKGELLMIEKINNRWTITETIGTQIL